MKKVPAHETPPILGKPPKGLVFERRPLHAHEIDIELHRKLAETRAFKETTEEDFKRILAELDNELGKI